MTFVSTLKESFALSPPEERQYVIEKLAVPNTVECYYYQGLVILQKIHDEVMKVEDPSKPRSPTEIENKLSDEMKDILSKLKAKNDYNYYNQLEARFQLLAYPFQTACTTEFLQKELSITSQQQPITDADQENSSPMESNAKLPSSLDSSLIDGEKLIQKAIAEFENGGNYRYLNLNAMSYPYMNAIWDSLSQSLQLELIKSVFNSQSTEMLGPEIINKLANIWTSQADGSEIDMPNLTNLTLAQMNQLIDLVPGIVLFDTSFVHSYLIKLVPDHYRDSHVSKIGFWDDHTGYLKTYLDRVDSFAERLPLIYKQLRSAIKFYKLRIDIMKQEFDEERLISFLSSVSNQSINTSPVPTRASPLGSSSRQNQTEKSVELPLFGNCRIAEYERNEIIEEYLLGLITHDKLTVTLESLGAYLDYHKFLKPLVAKIKLISCSPIQDAWIKDFGDSAYESLVKESFVSFANTSLNASVRRKPSDMVSLFVKTKNISRLSIRVFQIDTENYWRIHLNDQDEVNANKNINLDGFRPTFEQDFDFSSEPAIRVKYNEFKFGQGELAPEIFKGRGLWVLEFVGGENQCRAIVQKGYLRHIVQNTFAGHVVRVLDEEGQVVEKAKMLYDKQIYEADDSSNILVPYQDRSETKKVILVSSIDNYCEPASFHRLDENYSLEASFYVNPEMVSFNKRATVVVIPKLKLNGMPAPLSLLNGKMALTVETITAEDVKNISTCQVNSSDGDTIRFEFMVPDQLHYISFTLKAKVKTLGGKVVDVSADFSKPYETPYSESGVTASYHLRRTIDGKYYIQVFGKNGESKKDFKVTLNLTHAYMPNPIEAHLQTNENGIINLGELRNIKWIDSYGHKQWVLAEDYVSNLPTAICVAEEAEFKLACNTDFSDTLFTLYSLGYNGHILDNVTDTYLKKENGYVSIQGLPEGKYRLSLPSLQNGLTSIECTVIKPQMKVSERGIWSGWLLGDNNYAKQNGGNLKNPLRILETNITSENIQVKLENWNAKTFAIVTTSTFVPGASESLYSSILLEQSRPSPELKSCGVESTRSLFSNDKRISEEYQYILNRAKAEKWTGSNLTKPSLLVYPKKNADTHANTRDFDKEIVKETERNTYFNSKLYSAMSKRKMCVGAASCVTEACTNLAFLNHNSPLTVIPVNAETGSIEGDQKSLGQGANLFQMVVISGDQSVFHQQVINDDENLKLNDLRQSNNSNKPLICSKAIAIVSPKEKIDLHTHEYETVDSFEKLFDTVVKISSHGDQLESSFSFLKTWPSLSLEKKLGTLQERVCHELNLWLKKKDPKFFDEYVKPAIKSKLQKDFMDLYLIDGDLSEYRDNIHLRNSLTVAEKSLLASTGSSEHLLSVLRSFNDTFDQTSNSNTDAIFDTILSQSTLEAAASNYDTKIAETSSMPMSFFGGGAPPPAPMLARSAYAARPPPPPPAGYSPASPNYSPTSPSYSPASLAIAEDSVIVESVIHEEEEDEDDDYENDEYSLEQVNELREKAKQIRKKVSYKFAAPTSEWVETKYYSSDNISLQKFWVDYLEYFASIKSSDANMFVSKNFIYALNNIKEILFVLSLMDLPFASDNDWNIETAETNDSNKVHFSVNANSHPLLVFYRTLSEYDESFSSNSNQNLMLSQELFVVDKSISVESDECIKINPASQSLEPLVEYGNHLIVINISSKTVTCQITVQIPTGAVPTGETSYYQSKTISINPYSTWHEVVNTFYFPSAGEFAIVPVTVSSISGDQLLGKIDAIPVDVKDHTDEETAEVLNSSSITSQSWSKVASKGTNDSIISYLDSYRKLEKLDLSLIKWKMVEKNFARKVLDTLSQRHFYANELWEYGVMHQFTDIIQDLLSNSALFNRIGTVFESPLVNKNAKNQNELMVYDYYPLFNARAHQMKPTPEILNQEIYRQYNKFLEYLSLQSGLPSDSDLVILTTYLLLQDRVGEAHNTFNRIQNFESNNECQLQIDYLSAYLKTRVPVTKDASFTQQLDLQSIKDITNKYKDFGVLRWRQLFSNLNDFVSEVQQGDFSVSDNSPEGKRIRSEPVLEFEIDEQEQEIVVKYSNLQSVDIKYYDMDVEVMFSNNPFMDTENNKSSASNKNISWITPTVSETVDLPEKMDIDQGEEEDFDMIGVGQMNTLQFHRIPFAAGNKNMFIEVSGGGIVRQHAYYANSLSVHFAESFGVVCVMNKKTKRPLAGVYTKVYCRKKRSKQVHFWKDGYTGLNGVFDYVSVTQGNALTNNGSLKKLMTDDIEKLSVLILSDEVGATVKEVYPPDEN